MLLHKGGARLSGRCLNRGPGLHQIPFGRRNRRMAVVQPTELINGRNWLDFAGIPAATLMAISKE